MRLLSAALVVLGLLGASPAFAQASPSAYTTGYRYDAGRRLVGTISPDPDGAGPLHYAAVRNTYNSAGQLVSVEKGELASWQSESVAPASWTGFTVQSTLTTAYDAIGRKASETLTGADGTKTLTQYSYDALGQLDCTAVRMNAQVYGSLPASACTLTAQGVNGPDQITKNKYDPAGRLNLVQKGFGTPDQADYASYTYTGNGKQQDVTDGNGNKAEFAYDGFDRLSTWTFPSKTSAGQLNAADYEQYGYDNNANRTSLRKRDGSVITYAYDGLNRLTSKIIPSRADLTATQTRDIYYGYDVDGHQLYARFESGAASSDGVTNSYDGFGELVSSRLTMGTLSKSLTAQYDADGNRTQLVHPEATSAYTFTYAYDGLDRLNAICTGTATCTGTSGTLVDGFTFNNAGLLSNRSESSTGASSVGYTWDNAGRLKTQADSFSGGTGNITWTLTYNPSSQLASDAVSNTSYVFPSSQIGTVNRDYAVNGLNQYTTAGSAAFTYDANGDLTSDGTWTYTYDIENRLVKAVQGATTVNLTYDPLGRLFKTDKGTSGTTTKFVYDGDALALEYNSSGAVTDRYVHGSNAAADDPLVWYSGATLGTPQWLHADHLGSIVAITNASGANSGINTYDEYGINGTNNNANERFGYTGQAFIPELGLYYYKARFYSPSLGRFLQTDPIGYDGGANIYAYVGADPVDKNDPSGLVPPRPQNGPTEHEKFCNLHPDLCGGYAEMMSGFDWMAKHPKTTMVGAAIGVGAGVAIGTCVFSGVCEAVAVGGAVEGVAESGEALLEGSTGDVAANAANGAKLTKSLSSEEGVSELMSGGGRPILGAGTRGPLRDANELASKYGGRPEDWSKITSTAEGRMQTHAYKNIVTGEIVELKSIPR